MMEKVDWSEVNISMTVPCRYWQEDGVWNGVIENLPVVVCGQTREEVKDNLRDAFLSHMAAILTPSRESNG